MNEIHLSGRRGVPLFAALAGLLLVASSLPALDGDHDHPTVHHRVTTDSDAAQHWFDTGLSQALGFNHDQAAESFRTAIREDPECAMCHWGLALVLGPNINFPMEEANHAEARGAWERARDLAPEATPHEQAYIEALGERYAETWVEDRSELDQAYARAMRRVHLRYPDDLDAATLFAEALMDTTPWDYWLDDGSPKKVTEEFIAVLESVLKRDSDHPGAAHFLIHAVEKARPELGVPAADMLAANPQATGHLRHMASHIYIRVGRYHDASRVNQEAIQADNRLLSGEHAQGVYSMILTAHNVHFLWAASTLEGRSEVAVEAARELRSRIDEPMIRQPGYETLQHFWVTPLYALVRFGRWDEVLGWPEPAEDLLYPRAVRHYARGLALVRCGDLEQAEQELRTLRSFAADPRLDSIVIFDLNSSRTLMRIAEGLLAGELASARGDIDAASRHYERAIEIEDALTYDEPPPWHFPVRQAYGAALLEAGRYAQAERVYRADLEDYPHNGWSLFGLEIALREQGQEEEARATLTAFEKAWQWADVELEASRF